MNEFEQKQRILEDFLEEHNLEALVLQRVSSFAWATNGAASYINIASTTGETTLVLTPTSKYLVTNNIEASRLKQEEGLGKQGWEFRVVPWYEINGTITKITDGLRVGADIPSPNYVDVSAAFARVRAKLTSEEGERFRDLGRLCAQAVHAAALKINPGLTEYEIAGILTGEAEKRGVQVVVNLIATDERIFNFRHPLPTNKTLVRYAMLVLCGRKHGLICSVTRFVHFGSLPQELREKSQAVAQVDAAMIEATRPEVALGDIFQSAIDTYAAVGFRDEWMLHHQGGAAGYEPREYIAVPGSPDQVGLGQAFAWNPSITGTKSEDTILIGEKENEILTFIEGWPKVSVDVNRKEYQRPAILELT